MATRVCRADLHAVRHLLGVASVQIADADPANIECRLTGGGARLDVVAQASPRAWTQFDTEVVHVVQSSGPGSQSPGLPRDLPGLGYSAAWIEGEKQLVATNGTESTGGSFVTIVVSRSSASRAARGPSDLTLARAVATATLALAPRGPNPGPPPS